MAAKSGLFGRLFGDQMEGAAQKKRLKKQESGTETNAGRDSVLAGPGVSQYGRRLMLADEATEQGYDSSQFVQRREVLFSTLACLATREKRETRQAQAQANLSVWAKAATEPPPSAKFDVIAGDWGVVTSELTRLYGTQFAVLNMANAFVAGGGYVEGMPAQVCLPPHCTIGHDES